MDIDDINILHRAKHPDARHGGFGICLDRDADIHHGSERVDAMRRQAIMHPGRIPARNIRTRAWTIPFPLAHVACRCKQGNRSGHLFNKCIEASIQRCIHMPVHRLNVLHFRGVFLEIRRQRCLELDDVKRTTLAKSCLHFVKRWAVRGTTPCLAVIRATVFVSREGLRARCSHGIIARLKRDLVEVHASYDQGWYLHVLAKQPPINRMPWLDGRVY